MKQIYLLILLLSGLSLLAQKKIDKKLIFDEYFFESINERLKENFKQSNELLEQYLSIDNTNDVVFFKMAQNYFDLKDYDKSLIYLEKAQAINPDNKWYQKLFIEIKIKQYGDKKVIFKLIKDFEPIAQNKYLIGDLYRQVFEKETTKPKISKRPNVKPPISEKADLKQLWQQNKLSELLDKTKHILEVQPDHGKAYLYHAMALTKLKNYNKALDYLDMGIDFAISDKSLLKSFYKQYISIYQALNKPSQVKIYQLKLSKL